MHEFFRGWKRKTGCVTLAMACVLTVGWIRSYDTEDVITVFGSQIRSRLGKVEFWWRKMEDGVSLGGPVTIMPIPYWLIIIPLTQLSANLLLLSKLRQSNPSGDAQSTRKTSDTI